MIFRNSTAASAGLLCGQIRLAAHVGRIQASKAGEECRAGQREFVRQSGLELLECFRRFSLLERNQATERWQIADVHGRVLRKARFEILQERLRSRQLTGQRQREGGGV